MCTLPKEKIPCYTCTDRQASCHNTCDKYKKYKIEQQELKDHIESQRAKDRIIRDYIQESKEKARRKYGR